MIITRACPGAFAKSISRLDRQVAVFAVCRISPSLTNLQVYNLDAPGLSKQDWFLFIRTLDCRWLLNCFCLFQNEYLREKLSGLYVSDTKLCVILACQPDASSSFGFPIYPYRLDKSLISMNQSAFA